MERGEVDGVCALQCTVHDGISREVLSTPVHHTPDAAL